VTRPSLVGVIVALGLTLGCATKRLPPGTPPPEYETQVFPPWPPPSAVPSAAPAAASAGVVTSAPSGAEIPASAGPGSSPDAGRE
jgi:hypothetical protein